MDLHWHRRDLRLGDNASLAGAAEHTEDAVVPVFLLDPEILDYAGPRRCAVLLDALGALREQYRDRGSDLLVQRGAPEDTLRALVDEYEIESVWFHTEYTGLGVRRDRHVSTTLERAGVSIERTADLYLHEPTAITTADGDPYQRFQYFGKKWLDRDKADPHDTPTSAELAPVDADPLPTLGALDVDPPAIDIPEISPSAARHRLETFCDGPIYRYDETRDYPAKRGTSRLSTHLAFGTIGIRELYAATESAEAAATNDAERTGVTEYRRQLAWREFYAQLLASRPDMVDTPIREPRTPIPWRDDASALEAWHAGETGYPLVDAGMRQLRGTGFMHNRVRMVVASFLTKHLLIDWREGYRWFRRHLFDHDTANDAGGWQWAASTGADAQPYFRVFNPSAQAERFDPDATYITEHVPELSGVASDRIHQWPSLDPAVRADVAPKYPDPIVDHGTARDRAIDAFERAYSSAE